MRLGQLARKFDITTQDIVAYLKSKGIEANPHPNSKLDEEAEAIVLEHFDILPEQPVTEDTTEEEVSPVAPVSETEPIHTEEENQKEEEQEETPEEVATPEPEPELSPERTTYTKTATVNEILELEEEGAELDVHLIKAPKVELEGLKVVGKIDLPEPKVKTPEEIKAEEEAKEQAREERNRKRRKNGKYREPLSEEEKEKRRLKNKEWKRKREEWKAKKKKKAEEAAKKAAKEAHYKEKLERKAATAATKKTTRKKKKVEPVAERKPQPKTVLGKFWRWLNT